MIQGNKYIYDIVEIGGRALEYEDRFIIGCTTINTRLYDDKGPRGLLRIANERYYQFVVARALMSSYGYHVGIEKDTYDFVVAAKEGENDWPERVNDIETGGFTKLESKWARLPGSR